MTRMSGKVLAILILGVLLIFSAGSAFAAGQGESTKGESVKLQFTSWMVAEQSGGEVWLPERIKVWEKAHPGVTVEVTPLGWEDTPDKITMQIQGKNAPDVFTIESLWLGKFARMPGGVEDLTSRMDAAFTSTLVPAYKGGELDGKMAGLVWSPNPWVIVYNKELAKRAGVSGHPRSFDDFIAQGRAIHALGPDIYGIGLQLGVDEYSADTFHIVAWPSGGDILDSALKPAARSAGTVKTIRLIKDLVDQKVVPFGEEVRNLRTLFAKGKVGFFFEGPWIAGILDGEGMQRDQWGVAEWPGEVQPASHILMLSQQSKHKDLAFDLMKFLVTDETTTKEYFKRTGLLPMVKDQYKDPQYDSDYAKTFLAQMSRLKNPNVWKSGKKYELEIAFCQEMQKILLGQGGVDETLAGLDKKMADILNN
ncbi:MAG TPA: sugar ABC transporter substrate-binding protein [Spirochaetia bacterium]